MQPKQIYIGLDFGGTKTIVASADKNGDIIKKIQNPTPQGVNEGIELFKKMIHEVSNGQKIDAIGCSTGGPVDWKRGIINFLHMSQWKDVPLKDIMEKEFSCPFYVDNDCNVAALGELVFGEGKNYNDFIYITLSTGVGAGIVKNKQIFRSSDGEHPELGHQCTDTKQSFNIKCRCGATNCLESLMGGYAIEKRYGKSAEKMTTEEWEELGSILGQGLRNIIIMHAPQIIFLGGGLSFGAREKLIKPALEVVREQVKLVKIPEIKLSSLGYEAPLKGAIALAISGL